MEANTEDTIVTFPTPDAMEKALAVYDLEARPLDIYPGYSLPDGLGGRSVRLFGGKDCQKVKAILAKWRGAK